MRRHSVREILSILTQIEQSDFSVAAACEAHHITRMTYYRWLKQYPVFATTYSPSVSALKPDNRTDTDNRLAAENVQLKVLIAEMALDIRRLQAGLPRGGKHRIEQAGGNAPSELPDIPLINNGKKRYRSAPNSSRHPPRTGRKPNS